MNKIYINYNNTFHKKLSNPDFIPKYKENNEQNNKKSLNIYDSVNNKFFDDMNNLKEDESNNNKNLILDLNHYIPIDQNKLINTFSKTLFNNETNSTMNK